MKTFNVSYEVRIIEEATFQAKSEDAARKHVIDVLGDVHIINVYEIDTKKAH